MINALASMVDIRAGCPPAASDPRILHRDCLFDIFVAKDKTGQLRRAELSFLFNDDLDACNNIVWYNPGLPMTVEAWAKRAGEALLPSSIAPFPRHRWVNSLASLSEFGLLFNVHGAFALAAPKWLMMMSPAEKPCKLPSAPRLGRQAITWDSASSDTAGEWYQNDDALRAGAVAAAAVPALASHLHPRASMHGLSGAPGSGAVLPRS
jgi:hypothetical protein